MHLREKGHGTREHKPQRDGKHGDGKEQHQTEIDVNGQQKDRAADQEHGRADEHAQDHFNKINDHADIVGHARDKRARGEAVGLLDRQRHDARIGGAAQIIAEALRCLGGSVGTKRAEEAAHQHHQKHQKTEGENDLKACVAVREEKPHNAKGKRAFGNVHADDAVIDDEGHQIRQAQIRRDLGDHQKR